MKRIVAKRLVKTHRRNNGPEWSKLAYRIYPNSIERRKLGQARAVIQFDWWLADLRLNAWSRQRTGWKTNNQKELAWLYQRLRE
jgi:hypothetical protein